MITPFLKSHQTCVISYKIAAWAIIVCLLNEVEGEVGVEGTDCTGSELAGCSRLCTTNLVPI